MNQSLCMLLINFSSPGLQHLQQTWMGESSAFFEQLDHRVIIISTMARQEIRVMSTRRGDEVPFYLVLLARIAGFLYSSVYKKNDENITNL